MSASEFCIQTARQQDLPALMSGLRALTQDLDDPFEATADTFSNALFGAYSFVLAVPARQGEQTLGIALGAPLFSTMGGGTVLNESDRSAVLPTTVARQWHAI